MVKKSMITKQEGPAKFSTREYNRCKTCGRSHGYLKEYGICRICSRELAYKGEIPGVRKASWQEGKGEALMTTDPIADILTKIRDVANAKHKVVGVPASNIKKSIAQILLDEGFINGSNTTEDSKQRVITIDLKYGPNEEKVISGIKRISKPGLRVYARANEVSKVLGGLGIATVSTSKGLVADKVAREGGIGGEVICYVW